MFARRERFQISHRPPEGSPSCPPPVAQELAPRHAFAVLNLSPASTSSPARPAAGPPLQGARRGPRAGWPDWRALALLSKSDALFCKQLAAVAAAAATAGDGNVAPPWSPTVDEFRAFRTRFQKGGVQARSMPISALQFRTRRHRARLGSAKPAARSDYVPPPPCAPGVQQAARDGDAPLLQYLILFGWDPAEADAGGSTALHWAAGGGHLEARAPPPRFPASWLSAWKIACRCVGSAQRHNSLRVSPRRRAASWWRRGAWTRAAAAGTGGHRSTGRPAGCEPGTEGGLICSFLHLLFCRV